MPYHLAADDGSSKSVHAMPSFKFQILSEVRPVQQPTQVVRFAHEKQDIHRVVEICGCAAEQQEHELVPLLRTDSGSWADANEASCASVFAGIASGAGVYANGRCGERRDQCPQKTDPAD